MVLVLTIAASKLVEPGRKDMCIKRNGSVLRELLLKARVVARLPVACRSMLRWQLRFIE